VTINSVPTNEVLNAAELASEESRASATPMMEQYIEIKEIGRAHV
jgi:DNA mismatch repair protein MutS